MFRIFKSQQKLFKNYCKLNKVMVFQRKAMFLSLNSIKLVNMNFTFVESSEQLDEENEQENEVISLEKMEISNNF